MEPLAQFADSYVLAQGGDALYVVDQHALHERIRYERLRNQMTNWDSQPLIDPISLNLSPLQTSVIENMRESLLSLGFDFTKDASSLSLVSVPAPIRGCTTDEAVNAPVARCQFCLPLYYKGRRLALPRCLQLWPYESYPGQC